MGSHMRGNIKEVQDLNASVPKLPLILVSPGWSLTITNVGGASNRPMHWHTSVPILPLSSLEWSLKITGVGRA